MGQRFETPQDAMGRFSSILERRYRPPKGALFRVAVFRFGGKETLLAACAILGDVAQTDRGRADYGNLLLLEEWVAPLQDALDRIESSLRGEWSVAGQTINTTFHAQWEVKQNFHPSLDTYSGWHEWLLEGEPPYDARPNVPLGDPVLAFGLPPYRTVGEAVNEWVWELRTHDNPLHLGGNVIVLPDTRGRIASADWHKGDEVSLDVELNIPCGEVQVQAHFGHADTRHALISVLERHVAVPVPDDVSGFSIFLVHVSGERLSEVYFSSLMQRRGDPEAQEAKTLQQRAEADIKNGEGVEVEFKPFITPKDEKEPEIVRTVVAFANTRGGRIYLGVLEKAGSIQGVKGLRDAYNKPPLKAREEFEPHMRKLIGDKVKGQGLKCHYDFIEISGEPVGVVTVERGEAPPYSTYDDEVLIRKGSTNRRPDAQTELVQLCTRHRASPGSVFEEVD